MYRALLELPGRAVARRPWPGCGCAPPAGPRCRRSWLAAFHEADRAWTVEGYGLTEAGPVLTTDAVGGRAKPGSVGRPLPGVELRLVDGDGR